MTNLNWSTMEYEEKERTPDWYWALGIIVLAGSVTSIILHDYFFAVLLILGGLCLAMFANKKPGVINYEMNAKGIQINTHLYEYKKIKSFFVQTEGKPMLFLRTSRLFVPMLSTSLDTVNPEIVKNYFLENNVPEEEMKEHYSEKIIERLGL